MGIYEKNVENWHTGIMAVSQNRGKINEGKKKKQRYKFSGTSHRTVQNLYVYYWGAVSSISGCKEMKRGE